MHSEHQDIERIEAFVEGRMSDAERYAFEGRLEEDEPLLYELHAYRAARQALVDVFAEQGQRKAHNDNIVELSSTPKRTWAWAAAASIALLLSIGGWHFLRESDSLPKLAERYAVHESPLPVFMSAGRQPQVIMDEAMQAYGMRDYSTAITTLDQLPRTDTTLFFIGLAQMQLEQDATAAFEAVVDQPASSFRNKALYHLMLSAMSVNNSSEAQRLWKEQLAAKDHPYQDRLEALASEAGWRP